MSQPFRKGITSIAGWLAAALLIALPVGNAQAAKNSEQVVFSGIGLPPVSSEPFGFWIWCQVEQAPSSRGRYETDCNGAVYFYARGIVKHVIGEVTEPAEGLYEMEVESTDGRVSCTLDNVPPVEHGPNNTVTAACIVDGALVTGLISTNAVVNATGP
jgi:hypothetical protein